MTNIWQWVSRTQWVEGRGFWELGLCGSMVFESHWISIKTDQLGKYWNLKKTKMYRWDLNSKWEDFPTNFKIQTDRKKKKSSVRPPITTPHHGIKHSAKESGIHENPEPENHQNTSMHCWASREQMKRRGFCKHHPTGEDKGGKMVGRCDSPQNWIVRTPFQITAPD